MTKKTAAHLIQAAMGDLIPVQRQLIAKAVDEAFEEIRNSETAAMNSYTDAMFDAITQSLRGPVSGGKLVYVKCDKCKGYHAKQDKGDCEAFCYTIEQIDEKRDRLAARGSKQQIIVEA